MVAQFKNEKYCKTVKNQSAHLQTVTGSGTALQ